MKMVDKKAKEYADKVAENGDDYLKIYHAYHDGWKENEPEKGVNHFILLGLYIGVIITVMAMAILNSQGIYLITP